MRRVTFFLFFIVPAILLFIISCKSFNADAKKKVNNRQTTTSKAYVCANVVATEEITITDETIFIEHSKDGNAEIKGTILIGVGNPNQYYFPNEGEQKVKPGRYTHKADGVVVNDEERQCVYSYVTYK